MSASSLSAQIPNSDPGSKHYSEIAGVKYSVPKGFDLEQSNQPNVALMRDPKFGVVLFVAVPNSVDKEYPIALTSSLVSHLFPKEADFKWKASPPELGDKSSQFQTASGSTKGFNNNLLVQTHYLAVKVNGQEIFVGYIIEMGKWVKEKASALFEREDSIAMSMPGWHAQAHVLASITGEKYDKIVPSGTIKTAPAPEN